MPTHCFTKSQLKNLQRIQIKWARFITNTRLNSEPERKIKLNQVTRRRRDFYIYTSMETNFTKEDDPYLETPICDPEDDSPMKKFDVTTWRWSSMMTTWISLPMKTFRRWPLKKLNRGWPMMRHPVITHDDEIQRRHLKYLKQNLRRKKLIK